MVTNDETAADVARRHAVSLRWQQARDAIWQLDAELAVQIDVALRETDRRLLVRLATNRILATNVQELARLAWDELCETPNPRLHQSSLEA